MPNNNLGQSITILVSLSLMACAYHPVPPPYDHSNPYVGHTYCGQLETIAQKNANKLHWGAYTFIIGGVSAAAVGSWPMTRKTEFEKSMPFVGTLTGAVLAYVGNYWLKSNDIANETAATAVKAMTHVESDSTQYVLCVEANSQWHSKKIEVDDNNHLNLAVVGQLEGQVKNLNENNDRLSKTLQSEAAKSASVVSDLEHQFKTLEGKINTANSTLPSNLQLQIEQSIQAAIRKNIRFLSDSILSSYKH